jgi:hypothetical protein
MSSGTTTFFLLEGGTCRLWIRISSALYSNLYGDLLTAILDMEYTPQHNKQRVPYQQGYACFESGGTEVS